MKFSIKDFFIKYDQMRIFSEDLVTFTEEILNEKLHFLCSVYYSSATDLFLVNLWISKNSYRTHVSRCFCIESIIVSDNLLTGYVLYLTHYSCVVIILFNTGL